MSQEIDISPLRRDKGSHQVLRLVHSGTRTRSSCADLCGLIYGNNWYFQPHQSIVNMENYPKSFDGNKSYASTVASIKFKIGTVQGNLLLGFYFMAVILFSISSFKDVRVDVMISPTMQPCEEVPERTNYVLRTVLQKFDDRKLFYSVQKEELDEDLKLKHPKVAENYDF